MAATGGMGLQTNAGKGPGKMATTDTAALEMADERRALLWALVAGDHQLPGLHHLRPLLMFPVLVMMYVRLAKREEREALKEFGEAYANHADQTPSFFPHFHRPSLPPG